MSKYLLLSLALIPLGLLPDRTEDASAHEEYIRQYRSLAVKEMERSGVPASIKLAQALLESNGGRSELAQRARNHFGIKCGRGWKGQIYQLHDDDKDPQGKSVPSCFRVYRDVAASYSDHSDFLRDPDKQTRYGHLFRLPPNDHKRWAYGLQQAGYATNPRYAELLLDLIRRYQLDQYDLLGADASDRLAGIGRINDVRLAFARPDETLEGVAERSGVPLDRLQRYNDFRYLPEQKLAENDLVFLQPKRPFFRGRQRWHKVREAETLSDIAQAYGIRTESLRRKNRVPEGHEPLPGEKVKLRWRVRASETPRTRLIVPRAEGDAFPADVLPTAPARSPAPPDSEPGPPAVPAAPTPPATRPPEPMDEPATGTAVYHTVAPGDTLFRIATRFGSSVDQIKHWNQLTSDQIKTGQRLRVR
jgi:LysM repeat protein